MVLVVVPKNTISQNPCGVLYIAGNLDPVFFTAYVVFDPDQLMRELNMTITTTNVDSIIGHYWVIGDDGSWNLTEAPDLYTSSLCEHPPFL